MPNELQQRKRLNCEYIFDNIDYYVNKMVMYSGKHTNETVNEECFYCSTERNEYCFPYHITGCHCKTTMKSMCFYCIKRFITATDALVYGENIIKCPICKANIQEIYPFIETEDIDNEILV